MRSSCSTVWRSIKSPYLEEPPCLDQEEFAERAEWPELFIQGNSCSSLQSGILVLINDADWELLGELDYQLQDQDSVLFISTLHDG